MWNLRNLGWQMPALAAAGLMFAGLSAARADVKIGVFGPMTGDAAGYGQSLREAVDLVAKEKSAASGWLGQGKSRRYTAMMRASPSRPSAWSSA